MQKMNIVTFNDDNHEESVWIDGEYAGIITDLESVISKALEVINRGEAYKCIDDVDGIEVTTIYVCDDFEDIDEEVADEIWDWFNTVKNMTEDQFEKVLNKDWSKLYDLISEEKE